MDISVYCFTLLGWLLEILSRIVFYIKYRNYKHEILPPITNKLNLEPATSIAAKIRRREVTSREVVQAFVDRIKETNSYLNAVVENRFEEALEDADKVDQFLRENPNLSEELEKSKPFYGVPFTAKDPFQVKGFHNTAGVYARKDVIADRDAECVAKVKEAGGILLGTTNIPEYSMWSESSNRIYGTTNNPYSFNRTCGGSSGGEGSIISAAGSPMGIGSDIAGSIRIPACFNGIFGHKASANTTILQGHYPSVSENSSKYAVSGPMSRFATDLRPLMKIMTHAQKRHLINHDRKIDMKDLKIFYMEDEGGHPLVTPVNKEVRSALLRTVNHFKDVHSVPCKKVNLTQMKDIGDLLLYNLNGDKASPSYLKELTNGKGEVNIWWEIAKRCVGIKGRHSEAGLLYGALTKVMHPDVRPLHYKFLSKAGEELEKIFKEMLGKNTVFLFPTQPTAAGYHNESLFKPTNVVYTAIFNVMGLPATQCPLGLNSSGLPLGIQVIGGMYQDDLCLTVAEEIEKAFGGWVCPTTVKLL